MVYSLNVDSDDSEEGRNWFKHQITILSYDVVN